MFNSRPSNEFVGKTVLVAGGSKGLGKELAIVAAEGGANVIVLARTQETLEAAKIDISKARINSIQCIEALAVDLTDADKVEEVIRSLEDTPDYLFTVAGGPRHEMGFFMDLQASQLKSCMENNYYSAVFVAQSLLRRWIRERGLKAGADASSSVPRCTRHIIFVTSTAALVPIPGYVAYSPTKSAVRSVADTLRQEVLMYGGPEEFQIHCAFPGTFMSETFIEGLEEMPELTRIIERVDKSVEKLHGWIPSSQEVAQKIMSGVRRGNFLISHDLEGRALINNMRGPSPRDNIIWDTVLGLIAPLIWVFFRISMDRRAKGYR
ncbi:hypothetical protein AJ79_01573 [Helicocarpus griseus UAMH5409]|uniref:Uncharacterized protein n=1 Tax=Helicocarpus griseus UAMH5409 TaxID=1447875 RepID=A0A2B7Y639_9EURO|nr:hypothetical protein AJ79_01573 [Helicocarpus griseus UAMH5409]